MDVQLYENEYDQVYNNLFSWKIKDKKRQNRNHMLQKWFQERDP